jgi:hypothetical protein
MTLPRLAVLARYWRRHPPLHLLFAAVLGWRAPDERHGDLAELVAQFGVNGHLR